MFVSMDKILEKARHAVVGVMDKILIKRPAL